jgi:hypothetical protein
MSNEKKTPDWWKHLLKKPLPRAKSDFREKEVEIPSPFYLDALDFSDVQEIRDDLDQKIVELHSKPRELDEQEALFNDYVTSLCEQVKKRPPVEERLKKRRKRIEMTIRMPLEAGLGIPTIGTFLWQYTLSIFSIPASAVAIVLSVIGSEGVALAATFTAEKWLESEFNGLIHGISRATQALAENEQQSL